MATTSQQASSHHSCPLLSFYLNNRARRVPSRLFHCSTSLLGIAHVISDAWKNQNKVCRPRPFSMLTRGSCKSRGNEMMCGASHFDLATHDCKSNISVSLQRCKNLPIALNIGFVVWWEFIFQRVLLLAAINYFYWLLNAINLNWNDKFFPFLFSTSKSQRGKCYLGEHIFLFGSLIEDTKGCDRLTKRNKLCQLGWRPKVVPPLSCDRENKVPITDAENRKCRKHQLVHKTLS